jgi:tetratricopeptide (TPR) repeat protein
MGASTLTPPAGPRVVAARRATGGRSRASAAATWLFRVVALGLIGWNVWLFVEARRPIPRIEQAERWLATGRGDLAEPALRRRLERWPYDERARLAMARWYAMQGRDREAADELHQVPEWAESATLARSLEGMAYARANQMRLAESAWQRAIVRDLLHPAAWDPFRSSAEELLELYAMQERWDAAESALWSVYDEVDVAERPKALGMMLRAIVERIAPETGVRKLSAYVAADPGDHASRLGLARMLDRLGDHAAADGHLAICLHDRPKDPAVWRERLRTLQERGDRAGLLAAVRAMPPDIERDGYLWDSLAFARSQAGDPSGALEAHRKAVAATPFEPDLEYRLALAEQRSGVPESARKHLAQSQTVRDARLELLKAIDRYRHLLVEGKSGTPELRDSAREVAALCRRIGRDRLADALEAIP